MGRGMVLIVIGGLIGLLLAAGGSRLLQRLLLDVSPLDPLTFSVAAILFALVGLAACYLPVRRATAVNAAEALRYK
jgi:putative ABC transport system permease protein